MNYQVLGLGLNLSLIVMIKNANNISSRSVWIRLKWVGIVEEVAGSGRCRGADPIHATIVSVQRTRPSDAANKLAFPRQKHCDLSTPLSEILRVEI